MKTKLLKKIRRRYEIVKVSHPDAYTVRDKKTPRYLMFHDRGKLKNYWFTPSMGRCIAAEGGKDALLRMLDRLGFKNAIWAHVENVLHREETRRQRLIQCVQNAELRKR